MKICAARVSIPGYRGFDGPGSMRAVSELCLGATIPRLPLRQARSGGRALAVDQRDLRVVRLLCNGDIPLAVPDGLVEEIMRRRDGSGIVVLPPRRVAVGKAVRVAVGAFADLEGLFQEMLGRYRVVLLFNLLGRKVRASVPLAALVA